MLINQYLEKKRERERMKKKKKERKKTDGVWNQNQRNAKTNAKNRSNFY